MMGRKEDEAFAWLLNEVNLADKMTPAQYVVEYDAISTEMFRSCKAMPGAERLIDFEGIPTAMCSGSRRETYGIRREAHKDWLDLIPLQVFCGEEPDIKHGKPYPDGFLATMRRFPVPPSDPSNVLVFEDAPNGGRAAIAAGMKCVMVPAEAHRKEAMGIGVDRVLNSLEEFRPEEFGLPAFD
ncbi:HAD hydrolase, family IA, variant 3 [Oesophagostomum dentatum]|uniref:HAD hydrolase, family IA, variant 3 n=1 Tax=Oesophagostomum dentatum TaxID=61180 RepID=A0A0B1S635_OESDE|nr:HAD hydrolase, family IA, variant 3 [Oesophagostomum dentatum]